MFALLKIFAISFITAGIVYAQIQTQQPNTMRAGSSGSAGTTQQGPPYDSGIRGPNSAMGTPDTSAIENLESSGAITKKKPVGTIRLDAEPGITPTPSPSPIESPGTPL